MGLVPDMAGCGVWDVLQLVLTHWCMMPDPGASAGTLVGGAGSWGHWLQGPGVTELVFYHGWYQWLAGGLRGTMLWYVGSGPAPTGVEGSFLGWLWAQGVLWQLACWYLGLCP